MPLRTALVVLAVLVAGVAAGYVLGHSSSAAPSSERAVARAGVRRGKTTPVLSGRAEAGSRSRADEHRREVPHTGPTRTKPPSGPERDADPLLEIRVTDAEGKPVDADVHAVPCGVTKLDWDEIPNGLHRPPGPCRLPLPVAGTYDVVVKSRNPLGIARRQGVLVRAGETVPVDLTVPAGRPIHVVLGEAWPIADLLRTGRLRVSISFRAVGGAPGEASTTGPFPRLCTSLELRPPAGPWESRPLPPSLTFGVLISLWVSKEFRQGPHDSPGHGVFATPKVVRPGGTVRLHAERLARLHVRPRLEAPDAWPEGPIQIDLVFEDERGVHPRTHRWLSRGGVRRQKHPLIFDGRPGRARLAWDGPGITPGSLENLGLDPSRTFEVEMTLQLDANELPSREPLVVHVKGLEDPPPHDTEDYLDAAAFLPHGDDDDWPTVLEWCDDPTDPFELDYGWRRAALLLAWRGTHQVSRPTPIPPRGSMTVTMEPAGMTVIVPNRMLGEEMGVLRIRRADGLPFLMFRNDDPVLCRSALVLPGSLLGPLPAGRHVFEVELVGRRLPDATADVKAGCVGVLHLRW